MPKHAKEHVDFVKKFCICCFRKGKDLRPRNNAETTYLNLNKKKEDYSNLIKTILCQDCYAQVRQGIPHPFTKLKRQKNLTAIVKSTSPTMQRKVLSSSIKDLSTNDSGNTLALKTFGLK